MLIGCRLNILFVLCLVPLVHLEAQISSTLPVLRIASAATRPLAYFDGDGKPAGFYIDVVREAARREGRSVSYAIYQEGLERTLRANKADLWVAGVANPERRVSFYFSSPWWADDVYLLVREESPILSEKDLAGRKLGYGESPPLQKSIETAFPAANWARMDSVDGRARALCLGEIDAALLSQPFLFRFWQLRPEECRGTPLRLVAQNQIRQELSIASRYEQKQLADAIQGRIVGMMRDGTLGRIAAQYPMLSPHSSMVLSAEIAEASQRFVLEVALAATIFVLLAGAIYLLRIRAERAQVNQARLAAEDMARAKDQFLATMSHEVRTPLNAVAGYLDLLEQTPLAPDQHMLAREVRQSARALLSIVSEILDFSRVQIGQQKIAMEEFALERLFEEVVASIRPIAEAKGVGLVTELDPGVPARLQGDQRRLLQVLMNLGGNAVKFTDSGSVALRARFELGEGKSGLLYLVVEDTGPGIPLERQDEIFEPFRQLDSSDQRRHGGVGLGLSIVKRIVESLGGKLELSSRPGQGTRFEVQIPVAAEQAERSWVSALAEATGLAKESQVLCLGPRGENARQLSGCLAAMGIPFSLAGSQQELNALLREAQKSKLALIVLLDAAVMQSAAAIEVFWAMLPGQELPRVPRVVLVATQEELRMLRREQIRRFAAVCSWPLTVSLLEATLGTTAAEGGRGDGRERTMPHEAAELFERQQDKAARRILVVDDNELNRKVLRALLEKLGFAVDVAADGAEAVAKNSQGLYEVIFMDCQMPVMDGMEATRSIRGSDGAAPQPIIYGISASTEESTRLRCLDSGMNGYVAKPVSIVELKKLLEARTN